MNVRTIPAEVLIPAQALAAENPVWDADRGGLWWIDVRAPRLHFWSTNAPARQWDMPSPIGFVALGDEGQVVVGLVDGVCILDCNTGNLDHLFHPEPELADTRLNEGRVDPDGRLWFGLMQDAGLTPIGALFRWAPGAPPERVFSGVSIPNGLSFDAKTRQATFADNADGRVLRFDMDHPRTPCTLLAADAAPGEPDGCAIDADGNIWSARFRAGCAVRITRKGVVDEVVRLPAPNVAGLCFAGRDLDLLVITTLRVRMTEAELQSHPLAGNLFVCRPTVPGAPEARVKGLQALINSGGIN
mgnify:CR=1 FL=1